MRYLLAFLFLPCLLWSQGTLVTRTIDDVPLVVNLDLISHVNQNGTNSVLVYGSRLNKVTVDEELYQVQGASCNKMFPITLQRRYNDFGNSGDSILVNIEYVDQISRGTSGRAVILFKNRILGVEAQESFLSVAAFATLCNENSSGGGNVCAALTSCPLITALQNNVSSNTTRITTLETSVATNIINIASNTNSIGTQTNRINQVGLVNNGNFSFTFTNANGLQTTYRTRDSIRVNGTNIELYQQRANGTYALSSTSTLPSFSTSEYQLLGPQQAGNQLYWELTGNPNGSSYLGFRDNEPIPIITESLQGASRSLLDLSKYRANIGNSDFSISENRTLTLGLNAFSLLGTLTSGTRSWIYNQSGINILLDGNFNNYTSTSSNLGHSSGVLNKASNRFHGVRQTVLKSYLVTERNGTENAKIGTSAEGIVARFTSSDASEVGWVVMKVAESSVSADEDVLDLRDPKSFGNQFNDQSGNNAPTSPSGPSSAVPQPSPGATVVDFYDDEIIYWKYEVSGWNLLKRVAACSSCSTASTMEFRDQTGADAPATPTSPVQAPMTPVEGLSLVEVFDDATLYWKYIQGWALIARAGSGSGGGGVSLQENVSIGNGVKITSTANGGAFTTAIDLDGVLNIIVPAGETLLSGEVEVVPSMATYSDGVASNSFKLIIDNSANESGFPKTRTLTVLKRTGPGIVNGGNPLTYDVNMNSDWVIQDQANGKYGMVVQALGTRASVSAIVKFE